MNNDNKYHYTEGEYFTGRRLFDREPYCSLRGNERKALGKQKRYYVIIEEDLPTNNKCHFLL